MLNSILYEQPLNERIRVFMRLEQLFNQTQEYIKSETLWHARMTMSGLSEILEILNRSDLKTDILKELERNQINLAKLSNIPGVNTHTLDSTLSELRQTYEHIIQIEGQLGQNLRENEILSGLVKRNSLVGAICSFDLPLYHFWLNNNPEQRNSDLLNLLTSVSNIQYAITLLLSIIRESTLIENKIANNGFYQQNLNVNHSYQMIRVLIPNNVNYFAEISAGKHRFSIHFLISNNKSKSNKSVQIDTDIQFQLGCCAI